MCAVCHGDRGQGYKADQAPALAHPDFLATVSDDFLRFAIAFGRQRTTMSAWSTNAGGPLSDPDIDAVVQFLRSWQTQPAVAVDDSPVHGDSALGQALFQRTCERCHGAKAKYLHLLSRQLLIKARPGFLRAAIRDGRPNTQMQGYAKTLGEDGIENIMAFLRTQPNWLIPGETPGTKHITPLPLGPLPLNPHGRAPANFKAWPLATSIDVVGPAFSQHARLALLDARAPSDYMHQHIAGAVSVPFYDPSPYLSKLPRDAWLVCYCGCPHAESGQLADRLRQAGYTQVTVLDEGFGAWISKGYPTHTGAAP
jgi:cytochrome c oxidase cbb3-type subunit 3